MKSLDSLNEKQQAQVKELIAAINGANRKNKLQNAAKHNAGNNINAPEVQKAQAQANYAQQEAIGTIQSMINSANAENRAKAANEAAMRQNNGFPAGSPSINDSMQEFERRVMADYSRKNEINLEQQEQERLKKKLEFEKANMKFMTTNKLIKMDFEPQSLEIYLKKFIYANAIQNNFNYTIKDKNANNGLRTAVTVYGNLHYICTGSRYQNKDELMNKVKTSLMEFISNNGRRASGSKIALGLLTDYDNGTMEYDKVPSDEQINAYTETYSNPEVINGFNSQIINANGDDYVSDSDMNVLNGTDTNTTSFGQGEFGNPVAFSEDNFTAQPLFGNPFAKSIELNPRSTQKVMKLDTSNFGMPVAMKYSTSERFKKLLFENRNGTAYEFKKSWDYVLKEIKRMFPNASTVTRVAIMGTQLTVNGKLILLDNILDNNYGMELIDIIHIRETFKKFPMIQYLILDYEATQKLIIEYGNGAQGIWKLFQQNKPLRCIGLIPSNQGQPVNYTREDFAQTAQALNKQLATEDWRMKMDYAFAQKNPRLHEKSPGYKNSIFNKAKYISNNSMKRVNQALFLDKDPKLMRAFGFSTLALFSIAIGGVLTIPGAAIHGIKKIAGKA